MINLLISMAEKGILGDSLIRLGIRKLLVSRLKSLSQGTFENKIDRLYDLIAKMEASPVAIATEAANTQHYNVPAAFFRYILGKNLKYSSCLWRNDIHDLDSAEENMFQLTCQRAAIENGMDILELGCGWGSLTIWMAEHFPESRITAVSNSMFQRQFIEEKLKEKALNNVDVITRDMNDFSTDRTFDRIVSIEMFEHMRNPGKLLARVSNWMKPEAKLFIHVFCHREYPYFFEAKDETDWMSQYFFTGGMMPSEYLYFHLQHPLAIEKHWRINGMHYEKTLNAWLARMDSQSHEIKALFRDCYGVGNDSLWFQRWRLFFIACAELFGFRKGEEWYVVHYLFKMK